ANERRRAPGQPQLIPLGRSFLPLGRWLERAEVRALPHRLARIPFRDKRTEDEDAPRSPDIPRRRRAAVTEAVRKREGGRRPAPPLPSTPARAPGRNPPRLDLEPEGRGDVVRGGAVLVLLLRVGVGAGPAEDLDEHVGELDGEGPPRVGPANADVDA